MSDLDEVSHALLIVATVLKVNRMLEIAFENDLPLISLVQSVRVPFFHFFFFN